MKVASGFQFSGVHAGLKPFRKDLALVVTDVPAVAAGTFTINAARAAPVVDAASRLPASGIQALILNSGHANALTGDAGLSDVQAIHEAVAEALKLPGAPSVLSASTGIIGIRVPVRKVTDALPELISELEPDPQMAAEAVLTTDTRVKMTSRALEVGGREVTLTAFAKGSGMIAPQLATMLLVVVTDCAISPELLQRALKEAVEGSFNNLTVDNEMSTNDAAFLLANGKAGNTLISAEGDDFQRFSASLKNLCVELAKEIAADGEGSSKMLEVEVTGAPSTEIARDLARNVAGSFLVKAAMFGADPNWGRILATVGARVGALGYPISPKHAAVTLQGVPVYHDEPIPYDVTVLKGKMRAPEVKVQVALGEKGPGTAVSWGCDLTYDYVKLNADYSSLLVQAPGGGVAKDDRLANYSPSFKVSLLVEALSYISRFSGKRCVIKYGGAAMVKDGLKKSFCEDINLLRSVGLQPIVIHGGGPEITRVLEKLGRKSEFVDGMRVTDDSDLKVVEMVLTGSVNTELVTMLNRDGGHAVGLSGKDGALLRARKLVPEIGKNVGQFGEITSINKGFLEMLLSQNYVPVISPIGIGDDGQTYNVNADMVAAAVASALGADKLIFLTNVAGILDNGELVTDLSADGLKEFMDHGVISGGMTTKARSILQALQGGVDRVHVIDGRTPHGVIAELFTDRGIGTLITR